MRLTKTLNLPNPQSIKGPEDVKGYLQRMNDELQRAHRAVYDTFAGEVMAETPNWKMREAKQADVDSGDANTVGDLMTIHKTTGTELLVESTA